jgi:hypothetical protein
MPTPKTETVTQLVTRARKVAESIPEGDAEREEAKLQIGRHDRIIAQLQQDIARIDNKIARAQSELAVLRKIESKFTTERAAAVRGLNSTPHSDPEQRRNFTKKISALDAVLSDLRNGWLLTEGGSQMSSTLYDALAKENLNPDGTSNRPHPICFYAGSVTSDEAGTLIETGGLISALELEKLPIEKELKLHCECLRDWLDALSDDDEQPQPQAAPPARSAARSESAGT